MMELTAEDENIYFKGVFDAVRNLYDRGLLVLQPGDKPEANGKLTHGKLTALRDKAICKKLLNSKYAWEGFMTGDEFKSYVLQKGYTIYVDVFTQAELDGRKPYEAM